MFLLKDQIGEDIINARRELKLSREKLAQLSKICVKTIYHLEKGNRIGKIETFLKINNTLKENFGLDLAKKAGIKVIWNPQDLDSEGVSIIEGGLLGDGCIAKYGVYRQEAKDKKYLDWLRKLLDESGVKSKVIPTKNKSSYSRNKIFYCLYTHSCPAFFEFRKRWYIDNNKGKGVKRIPANLHFNPTVLLHWYLGDGNFKRDDRKFPKGGRPTLRLFANDFLQGDIEVLIEKLKKDLCLNFYTSPKLNRNIEKGYVLYLCPTDLFKFFEIIGFNPPKEIENCITEERNKKIHTFKEKWPNENDWVKILAKTNGIGKFLQARRKEINFTQKEVAEKINITKHHVSQIECDRKRASLKCFNKFLEVLKLEKRQIFLASI